ncbi:MAG TPA: cyclopropane-fatty-acyl-phospholipid synthase family protein [Solirubrobacteraceae bacterium]|nr:cyclopropane-fatty-acyl-phospholipid synthase family protein [Solirubrobacteraceae bacterium]
MPLASTTPLRREVEAALPRRPFRLRFWDGTGVEPTEPGAPTFTFRSPGALAHVLRAPGELGIGRAYVSGLLDVDDIDKALRVVDTFEPPKLGLRRQLRLAGGVLAACGLTRPPRPPRAELRLRGERHTVARDRRAVRHHYDVGNDFFALFLDESMTYSCACFSRGAKTLEEAQETKLEMVCTKLGLREGERVLDVGCGWGSFALHAATRHGVHVVGITLSEPQAELARQRAAQAGVADRVEIRVADYREVRGERFDAIASIGMVEHVGAERIDVYARQLAALLVPKGRLLNHGIAKLSEIDTPDEGPFSERFVFPDGVPLPLSRVTLALERAGFVPRHVEGFADDYAETLTHWIGRYESSYQEAVALAGSERARVWRLYLRAARLAFLTGEASIYQVLAHHP